MSKLRVLFLTSSFVREGGVEKHYIKFIAEGLIKNDIEVGVLIFSTDRKYRVYMKDGIKVFEYPYTVFFEPSLHKNNEMKESLKSGLLPKVQFLGYIRNTLKNVINLGKNYDLIHAFWFIPSGTLLAFANKIIKKPVLATSLGSDLHLVENYLIKTILKFVNRNYKHLSANSEYLKNRASIYGIDTGKISVINTCIRLSDYDFPRTKKDKIIIGNTARLFPFKRVEDLLTAVSQIKSEEINKNIEVWIIGEGPQKEYLISKSRELGLTDKVKFFGFVKEWPKKLSEIDIFVNPSIREGMSTVNIEGLASGCVVVATRGHGNDEIIDDKINGFLYEDMNVDQLKSILVRLINDDALRERIIVEAREKAVKFDYENIAKKYIQLYSEILDSSGR